MLARAAKHVLRRPLQWETSSVDVCRAISSRICANHIPCMFINLQRTFCAPAWHQALGTVPRPRKEKVQVNSSEIVPIEHFVDQKSLGVLENIHNALSSPEVFQAIKEVGVDLNEVHIARAIVKLAEVHNQTSTTLHVQEGSTEIATLTEEKRIADRRDKDFVSLCQLTLRHAREMDSGSLMDILKATVDLGIPQSSLMVQTLMAVAENRLDRLNCDELAQFARRLQSMHQTDRRVGALLQAVALVLPTRINDCVNAASLSILLRIVGGLLDRHTLAQMGIRLIAILRTKEYIQPQSVVFDTTYAVSAFQSIGYRHQEFLNEACEILTRGMEHLPSVKLKRTLISLSFLKFCSPSLLEGAGDLVASNINKWSFEDLAGILTSYSVQRFLHKNLLNKVASAVCERSLDGEDIATLIQIVTPFAKFLHTPTDFGVFDLITDAAEGILESSHGEERFDYRQLVHLVGMLAMCGAFSPQLLARALSRQCWESVIHRKDTKAVAYLKLLHTIIRLDRPALLPTARYSPSDSDHPMKHLSDELHRVNQESDATNTKRNDKLKLAVAEVLQDVTQNTQRCLATDVTVGHGYTVDFVVRDLEKTKRPVAMDLTRRSHYCANFPERLLGREVMKRRHLEALGYSFHMIPRCDWIALASPRDRVEYIQQRLGLLS